MISREKKLTIPTVDPIIRILNHWSRSWLWGSSREDLMIFWNTDLWSSNYKTKSLFWWFFPSETYLANIWCQHNGKFSVSTESVLFTTGLRELSSYQRVIKGIFSKTVTEWLYWQRTWQVCHPSFVGLATYALVRPKARARDSRTLSK